MIKYETRVKDARCDACGRKLDTELAGIQQVHYGRVENHFGYGHRLDPMGGSDKTVFHLCGPCFVTALKAVGLKTIQPYDEKGKS